MAIIKKNIYMKAELSNVSHHIQCLKKIANFKDQTATSIIQMTLGVVQLSLAAHVEAAIMISLHLKIFKNER